MHSSRRSNTTLRPNGRLSNTNTMLLLDMHSTGSLEPLHVPKAGLEEGPNKIRKAMSSSVQARNPNQQETYKAMKANASSVRFRLHLFTKRGELTAQPPLYS